MCTGSSARVRSPTAAAAACGSRLSVTGSMSANTGRARSYSAAFAEATNENGLVITSSPSPPPAARSARCRPAVPLLTALASGARTCSAKRRSNSPTRGPSESCPERSTSSTACSSAVPMTGRASGITSVASESARGSPARQHAVLERVDERVPGGRDQVLRDADRAPHLVTVGGVDEHARDRAGALGLVEDPDLEVDQLDVAQVRVDLPDRSAQRLVERVHRAVALGVAHVALAVHPDLHRGFGVHLAVDALLDDHPPGLHPEQRLVDAGLLAHEQLEGAIGGLELEALVL